MNKITKRILSAITAVTVAGVTALSSFAVVGDIDNSGKVTTSDARTALRFALRLDTPTEEQKLKADVDSDNKITSSDSRLLLRAALRLESLEYYSNFYTETVDSDGYIMTIGLCGKDLFAETNAMGQRMGILAAADGSLYFIDSDKKEYSVLSKQDLDTFSKLIGDNSGISNIRDEIDDMISSIKIYKPIALLDMGYEKSTGEWDGKTVDTYTAESGAVKTTYYFDGNIFLGTETLNSGKLTTARYNNFTTKPESKIYAFKQGYKELDFIEMFMAFMG